MIKGKLLKAKHIPWVALSATYSRDWEIEIEVGWWIFKHKKQTTVSARRDADLNDYIGKYVKF